MELFDTRLNAETSRCQGRADRGGQGLRRAGADRHRPDRQRGAGPRRAAAAADRQLRHRRRQYRRRGGLQARHHRHQHAGRADRGHRRHDHGADPRRLAPAGRGRAARPLGRVGRLEPDLDARPPDLGQAAGHRRHGPDRQRRRAPGPGLRALGALPQPAPRPGERRAGARGDLLGEPRPDAGADGHRSASTARTRRRPSTCSRRGAWRCCSRTRSSSTPPRRGDRRARR